MNELERAVETGDPNEVLRTVEQLVERRDWAAVLDIARMCRLAVDRGKQLWGAAEHAYYRAALHAPAEAAAASLVESPGRFALGPLSEVIAQHHTWAELAPYLRPSPASGWVMAERLLRGETIGAASLNQFVEVPFALQPWETDYELPVYSEYKLAEPRPAEPPRREAELPSQGSDVFESRRDDALAEVVAHWAAQSTGILQTSAVEGSAEASIAALGLRRVQIAKLSTSQAMALIAWASASGAAHGRRRGLATGRFEAWWLATRLLGLEWPPEADELRNRLAVLRWVAWDAYEPDQGWRLQLAVEDTENSSAWSISAQDEA